jgi:hypothetical protein
VTAATATARRVRVTRRPDLWATYPDARLNLRPTRYGLSAEEYRAEAERRRSEGWATWEISMRFPADGAVAR